MISLNYKCSKDAKTGLGLVRECLVQILLHYLESQVDGQSSCIIYHTAFVYIDMYVHTCVCINMRSTILIFKTDFISSYAYCTAVALYMYVNTTH